MMIPAKNWEKAKLGNLLQTQKGYAFKSTWYCEVGYPIVKVSNFTQDSIDASSLTKIPDEIAEKYLRYELHEGDVVVQTVGSWPSNPASVVGKCICVPRSAHKTLLNQNAVRLDPNEKIGKRFLYYSLRAPNFCSYIVGTAQGAASQAAITLDAIRDYDLVLPTLLTQSKIAAILSAYDYLIENNLRRIKILEEMAQNIYREWFVKFRFPGHEKARFVDSPLGRIPEKWDIVNLLDIAVVKYGKNLPTKNLAQDGDYPVYGAAKIIGRYNEYTRGERTIITGCRGSVGEMQITVPKCFVTNNSFTFDPQQRFDFYWLFHSLKERGFADVIGGAAQPQITLDGLSKVQILLPSKSDRVFFHKNVENIFYHKWNLEDRNIILRRTRDLLLPKLISGGVDVSELDITVSEEVA